MNKDRKLLLVGLFIALLAIGWIALTPIVVTGARVQGSGSAEATTPYGESISIRIGSGTSTSGQASVIDFVMPASWLAYVGGDTQDVYDVDGAYKSQEQVTLSYSLSVTYSNVNTIKATVKIKATDNADQSMYEYTLATQKALSGASPIADNGQVQKSITDHLTEITASTTGATVKYEIYCQVTGTGATSGETLTATVAYTQFGQMVYTRTTESSSADVTPTVSVASWVDDALGLPDGTIFAVAAIVLVGVAYKVVKQR
ncbi:MAG: hypothetical protein ABIJ47_03995 [Candidatus Bathyarchaeota archaeon]